MEQDSSSDIYDNNLEKAKYIQSLSTSDGILESPVDLNISNMIVMNLNPLQWYNHQVPPKKLKLTNTGHTVILSGKWQQERPYLSGGPFLGNYVFSQIHFHWGETEMDGSEHYVDGGRMPMELHAVHFKSDYSSQEMALRQKDGVAILVYFFKLQTMSNELLKEIIEALPFIQPAHSSTRLDPMPIMNIIRPFARDYFVYWGSLIVPEKYSHSILWVISREPIGISYQQVAEFRNLKQENNTPILSNIRPVQEKGTRKIFHVCPSGSRYASLLFIPREPPSLPTVGNIADTTDDHEIN